MSGRRKVIQVTPMGAPRMTKADRWKKRDCVQRYWAFKDAVRLQLQGFQFPDSGAYIRFFLPMPKSWSKKKKAAMDGQPHQQKPDKDNLEKALLDALFDEDKQIWQSASEKRWAEQGRIEITTSPQAKGDE